MHVATAAEMRNIDRRTIGDYAVPGIVLMENAGLQLLRTLQECVPALAQQSVSPLVSVIVTDVLLNVARMWATPTEI